MAGDDVNQTRGPHARLTTTLRNPGIPRWKQWRDTLQRLLKEGRKEGR